MSRAGIDVRGRSRRLKINYRTSEQIRLLAHRILNDIEIDDLDGGAAETLGDRSVFRGPEPQTIEPKSEEETATAIVTWVKGLIEDAGLGTHEICITPGNGKVLGSLENAGIKTLELKPRQKDPGQEEQGVRYGTKKRIKGLEFKAVALLTEDSQGSNQTRFADYVAATRAREHLLVVKMK